MSHHLSQVHCNKMPGNYPLHCLIGAALVNTSPNGEMKVTEIYTAVEQMFPMAVLTYPNTWKNSLRHCLSKSSYFEKVDQYTDPLMAAKKGNRWRIKPQKAVDLYMSMEKYLARVNKMAPSHNESIPVLCAPINAQQANKVCQMDVTMETLPLNDSEIVSQKLTAKVTLKQHYSIASPNKYSFDENGVLPVHVEGRTL